MSSEELVRRLRAALDDLPDRDGGIAVVLATSGSPPAMAMLSTGDVHIEGDTVRIGIHASSSAASRLGEAFTLLVPLGATAVRIEAVEADVEVVPPLARLSGRIRLIRPTAEPPWMLEMRFTPEPRDHPLVPAYVGYWRSVRQWLAGERQTPPDLP